LTVTGGLSFFGGPGNNYSTHAIAEMVRRLREAPGTSGLVLANGGPLTNQAVGIYSTRRSTGAWLFDEGEPIQARLDAMPKAVLNPSPQGRARIEALTVLWDKQAPQHGFLLGRMADGDRFVAKLDADATQLAAFASVDASGLAGTVAREGDINRFHPDAG
jgi:acetyl-CoA C-acetyltransferase